MGNSYSLFVESRVQSRFYSEYNSCLVTKTMDKVVRTICILITSVLVASHLVTANTRPIRSALAPAGNKPRWFEQRGYITYRDKFRRARAYEFLAELSIKDACRIFTCRNYYRLRNRLTDYNLSVCRNDTCELVISYWRYILFLTY